jgi:succinate dehydrogenase/fumarate reductase flavoprotein subunit|tara:strand:+ start:1374 stop:3158 length:1785 start_codon:yes stop_codon:yes gene_type:complete
MPNLNDVVDRAISTDVLIIGSEGTGARAALEIQKAGLDVTVVTKGVMTKSGATLTADGDIDMDSASATERLGVKGDLRDSPRIFFEDMVRESKYISNQELVDIHVNEAPDRVVELVEWGAKIDGIVLAQGHTYPRGVWMPGVEIMKALEGQMKKAPHTLVENFMVVELLKSGDRVIGAAGFALNTGEFWAITAKAVIMATGGGLRPYPHTTAPEELTGDGQAIAYRAGTEMIDMEFPMFLPYCLLSPVGMDGVDFPFLLTYFLDAYALNRNGERYMSKWDPKRMEKSTRDINSIAQAIEALEGRGGPKGGTYLSLTHLPANLVEDSGRWLPIGMNEWRYGEFDLKAFLPDLQKVAVEVGPACHYQNGGIQINAQCETNIDGLFAAGEGTGSLMGGNRISGNAVTQTQVWGVRAGISAAAYASEHDAVAPDPAKLQTIRDRCQAPLLKDNGLSPIKMRQQLQQLAGDKIGVVRDQAGLEEGLKGLEELEQCLPDLATKHKGRIYNREWLEALQMPNLVLYMQMVANAALTRKESRGAHYRLDHPKSDNTDWLKNVIVSQKAGKMSISAKPVVIKHIEPPAGVFDYGHIPDGRWIT